MKTSVLQFFRAFAICFILTFGAIAFTSCQSAPTTRVQEVKTLKAVGLSVDATMRLAAQLYHDGKISADTWQRIAIVHQQFLPAFNLAVKAVQSDLTPASPNLLSLAAQLSAILTPYLSP